MHVCVVTQVIRLLGVCSQNEAELMMVLEMATRGDLKNFLRDCRPTDTTPGLLSHAHLVRMGVDVARGMEFLSDKQFVHRDLACRCDWLTAAHVLGRLVDDCCCCAETVLWHRI